MAVPFNTNPSNERATVPDNKPMWTAARLNGFIARFGNVPIGLVPPGGIYRNEAIAWVLADENVDERVDRPSAVVPAMKKTPVADICCLDIGGLETATMNLARLPVLLAISAFDPEAWCAVIVHPGAPETTDGFRDGSCPLREWVLRVAVLGQIGNCKNADPIKYLLEATHDAGFGSIEPEPTCGILESPCILQESSLPSLGPEIASKTPVWLAEYLQTLADRQFDCSLNAGPDAIALAAGVWQMNGFLDRSHELAQSVEGRRKNRAGDYWHAIMHRREPDYSNAKYWCRRVGQHAIHDFLARDAQDILSGCKSPEAPQWNSTLTGKSRQKWDSFAFVDLCEEVADGHDTELSLAARQIQMIEMALLLSSTYHDASA
jgi:hypothetical protein